ncbi:MAG: exonuclease domain-containing protein [Firmicutes bacterium]|nr:exonuclease domain-containing protein [Bacillota bacterium]
MTPIVIDLEWNHPLQGRSYAPGLPGEIIQIGAAKLDDGCNVIDTLDIMIKPQFYTKMNKQIKELTLITDEDIAKGISIQDAVKRFRSWCGEDYVFVSWGPDDLLMLERNMLKFGLDIGWLPKAYDAQLMFDDMEMQENRHWALNYALYHYNEKPDGAHNALADVLSTVLVLKHLDLAEGLSDDYFRCDRRDD